MSMQSRRRKKSVDAQQLLQEIQNSNPEPPITLDDLQRKYQRGMRNSYREDSNLLIQDFISCFAYKNGKATLNARPDDSVLEIIAEGFSRYWYTNKGTLDSAFGLQKHKKGRGSGRERERIRIKKYTAESIYTQLRDGGLQKKKAVDEVAKLLCCSPHSVITLLFRQQKTANKRLKKM